MTRSVLKIDTLLKAVMTPDSPADDFVSHYLLLIPCQSFSDFQKVLDLKGVRRAEQNQLLDLFLAKTSTADGLADASFLTALDMDPAGGPGLASPGGSGVSSPALGASSGAALGSNGLFGVGGLSFAAAAAAASGAGASGAASREGSRSSTPGLGPGGGGRADGGERGKEALQRLGARIGIASRLFGGGRGDA